MITILFTISILFFIFAFYYKGKGPWKMPYKSSFNTTDELDTYYEQKMRKEQSVCFRDGGWATLALALLHLILK